MKKIVTGIILSAMAFTASAEYNPNHHPRHTSNSMIQGQGWVGPVKTQHHWHGGHHRGGHGWGWVVPAVIGGTVVYAATRPPVVVQQPQPVIVQQPPAEVVYIDGIAYKKQVMVINGQTQEVLVRL